MSQPTPITYFYGYPVFRLINLNTGWIGYGTTLEDGHRLTRNTIPALRLAILSNTRLRDC